MFCVAGQKMKTKNDMMGKNTDAIAKTIAETKKEVVKEYNNETAENGGAKIIEVYSICPSESLTIDSTERNLVCLVV